MVLAQADITLEHREILLKDRTEELLKISSKGTVPVLHIDDNNIIDDSLDIMIWGIQHSQLDFLKENSQKQLDMLKMNDNNFKYWLNRYKYFDRFPELRYIDYQNKCKEYMSVYDKSFTNNIYFMGDFIQCVDIAIFPFIRQCANVDFKWFQEEFINLNIWFQKIVSSKLFLSTMKKYEVWNQIDKGHTVNYNIA